MNKYLLQLCRQRSSGAFYASIMIIRNDAETGLFNGEVGLLVNDQYALFTSSKITLRRISAALLPPFEYAIFTRI